MQDDILRNNAVLQLSIHFNFHLLRLVLQNALRSQHLFYLGGADTKADSSKSSVCGCMAVSANISHTGKSDTQFGSNYVHNDLKWMAQTVQLNAELITIFIMHLYLLPATIL